MKLELILISSVTLFSVNIFAQPPGTGSIVSGISITYDGAGNRVLRRPGVVCIGCKVPIIDTLKQQVTVDNAMGSEPEVYAYPNPTNSVLNIENSRWNQGDKAMIEVFDIVGRCHIRRHVLKPRDIISFEGLPDGNYVVVYILNEKSIGNWKVTKM